MHLHGFFLTKRSVVPQLFRSANGKLQFCENPEHQCFKVLEEEIVFFDTKQSKPSDFYQL